MSRGTFFAKNKKIKTKINKKNKMSLLEEIYKKVVMLEKDMSQIKVKLKITKDKKEAELSRLEDDILFAQIRKIIANSEKLLSSYQIREELRDHNYIIVNKQHIDTILNGKYEKGEIIKHKYDPPLWSLSSMTYTGAR
jgi:predicted ribosome-associated RNA-binding protein Tma20